jgi:hypothetical protein
MLHRDERPGRLGKPDRGSTDAFPIAFVSFHSTAELEL